MATLIPDNQIHFAQLAAQQQYITPHQVRSALELYRRYQDGGGEVPSVARILVAKGWLSPAHGELLLRHLVRGERLPDAPVEPPKRETKQFKSGFLEPPVNGGAEQGVSASDFEVLEDDLGLEPPGSAIDLPVGSSGSVAPVDERQALIDGLGATVLRKELREIKGYEIKNVIGEGSMGIVYKARQKSMDRMVALKVLPVDKTKDQRFVEEFLADARNMGRLNHPNLIRVHEVGKAGETYFFSMELVEGQRLDEWMDECENGRIDPRDAIKVFIQVCTALDYGFRAGIIHREIRLNSIHVSDDGQTKLADLGMVKDEQTRFLNGENAYYVAPEQVRSQPVDTRTDIFCLGCCLFQAVTGEPPYEGGTPREVLNRRINAATPNPREINPDLPNDLTQIIMKMMDREPTKRYQTPAECAEALKKISFAHTTSKKPLVGNTGLRKPVRRHSASGGGGRYGATRPRRRYRPR